MEKDEKQCSQCKVSYPITLFWKNGVNYAGLPKRHSFCKFCQTKIRKANYSAAREKQKQERNRKKIRAQRVVQGRVRNGTMIKQPCWICGELEVDAHHILYDFPLKVIWLCRRHHIDTHVEKRNE